MSRLLRRLLLPFALLAVLAFVAAGCGDDDTTASSTTEDAGSGTTEASDTGTDGTEPSTDLEGSITVGYFPNVTHAPALVGVDQGLFAESLGEGVDIETRTFNSGTEATEALLAGGLDITYIGPNPAINAFAQSEGAAVRLVSGSTSGGAFLVVNPEITSIDDLADKTIATPSLGNTQDVALRYWLKEGGYETTPEGGGDVSILPQDNALTLDAFTQGQIDGAWVPEPWATRLIEEGNGEVLVDEADLWEGGQFVTTHILVNTEYLEENPEIVKAFLEGHLAAVNAANDDPEAAQASVVTAIEEVTGSEVSPEVIAASWENLEFTVDPIAASLQGSADHAIEVEQLDPVELDGIYDLTLLNEILADAGDEPVEGL